MLRIGADKHFSGINDIPGTVIAVNNRRHIPRKLYRVDGLANRAAAVCSNAGRNIAESACNVSVITGLYLDVAEIGGLIPVEIAFPD